ncbi:MAG: peroxiredoxin, partial [Hydrogenophaga sp.]|uniref:peroxiredoxin n=1 Tax=Hydrogenophaga sp. TaxID=1904254 RepID=UPI002614A659
MNNLQQVDWSRLPQPEDDGGARHLTGMRLPTLELASTDGGRVDPSRLRGRTVLYLFPMTGRPDVALPPGWDEIPGARGCTPQSCAFRDHFAELKSLGVAQLFGVSTQDTTYQCEAVARLHLPFPLLSDHRLSFATALSLPVFEVQGLALLKRLTLIAHDGVIEHVFYPVFPPDRNADDVIEWLKGHHANQSGKP